MGQLFGIKTKIKFRGAYIALMGDATDPKLIASAEAFAVWIRKQQAELERLRADVRRPRSGMDEFLREFMRSPVS